ncbi:hypothetical protein LDO26_08450 [Luteimonas sp. BDR2-5]|uniref:hypothetical protein n=1 Tax=Proluteimonas luteida TaxID=2878685 RepID=UPI001E4CB67C|nr:hypothetical protein [Luteimonas sp. BDR2-5]MCD9028239.1 hypothetical protein [Luteimonas sp. BDR2-5]
MSNAINRCLLAYSGVLTAAVAIALLTGAAGSSKTAFEEIDVQRLNLREPDGTLRYVLSSSAKFPGAIIKGTEYPHPRPQAGMLFYNDEGSEVGGLIFAGSRDADGKVSSGGSLTFDRYEQDQIVQIIGLDEDGRQVAGMQVSDRPDRSIVEHFTEQARLEAMPAAERDALLRERSEAGHYGAGRLFVGRSMSGNAVLQLSDGEGQPRMRMSVARDGTASLDFLDADGEVVRSLTPDDVAGQQ